MAVPRPKPEKEEPKAELTYPSKYPPMLHGHQNGGEKHALSKVEAKVVELYGRGLKRRRVAQLLMGHLAPAKPNQTVGERHRLAIRRLKQMEERKWFRDALWEYSMVLADLDVPRVMMGVRGAARRGRVDAAKLVLGITGRYDDSPKDQVPTQVNIVFGAGVPRPESRGTTESQVEAVEEADFEEIEE